MIFTSVSKSQIKVANTTGYVKIGSSAAPTKNLDVSGCSIFTLPGSSGSIIIDNTGWYGGPAIYPSYNLSGDLGLPNNQLYKIYVSLIYYGQLISTSDIKTKENIRNIDTTLNKIMKLRPVIYDIKYNLRDSISEEKKTRDHSKK